jgi:CDP-glycerol glycerophosphotransferase (TagB/SpsB family)
MTPGRAASIRSIQFNISDKDAETLAVGDYANYLPAMITPPSTKPQIVQIDYLDKNRIQTYENRFGVEVYKGFVFTYEDGAKRAYLYVPTFRGKTDPRYPDIDWEYMDAQLHNDEVLAVKPHPYGEPWNLYGYKHIIELPKMQPSVNYLIDCDVLITDYSSIMFDGYLLDKPCVLFEKNLGYTETRGMYLEYPDQYSTRYASTEAGLLRLLRSADGLTIVEEDLAAYVAGNCDGYSCERIINFIKEVSG